MNVRDITIKKFHEGLVNKEFSALEIAQELFQYIEKDDKEIGAYLTLFKDEAYRDAEQVDISVAKSDELPPLAGVPLAIKDNILIKGSKTTAASHILEDYIASYDASVIKKLKEEHSVFLGKTNLDEFAMGSSTENSGFQITRNPHDAARVPGGSSGGSAAAVAAGEAVAALGSDTGGSVRQPAAFCGVVGLKPTYGSVSRHGLIAMASSLDQIGPITKTVEDARILLGAIARRDFYDATSSGVSIDELDLEAVKRLRVGLPREYFVSRVDREVESGVEEAKKSLENLGLQFKEISLPHTEYAIACYYIIMPAEVSTNLARYDGIRYSRIVEKAEKLQDIYLRQREKGFGIEAKRRILLGTFVLSSGYYDAYYGQAQRVRRLIAEDFERAFEEVDVILTPTTPTPPFKIGERIDDPLAMYLSDVFTAPANLAGLPAISIPVSGFKTNTGLPIGFQLIGRKFRESDILGIGSYYEKVSA